MINTKYELLQALVSPLTEESQAELSTVLPDVLTFGDQHNPHHCYSLWRHTLEVVNNCPQAPLLRVAAFFHDCGKPYVAAWKINRIGEKYMAFWGHAQKSAEIAKPILEKLGFAEKELKYVLTLIEHHDDYINRKVGGKLNEYMTLVTKESTSKHMHKLDLSISDYRGLLILIKADAAAQTQAGRFNGFNFTYSSKVESVVEAEKLLKEMV